MLPRVSAALSQFIKPIAGGVQKTPRADLELHENPFQKQQPEKKKGKPRDEGTASQADDQPKKEAGAHADPQSGQEQPQAKVIPFPAQQTPEAEPQAKAQAPQQSIEAGPTFLHLFASLQDQREILMRWLGGKAYQSTNQGQKRGGKFKKGVMLDRKAE